MQCCNDEFAERQNELSQSESDVWIDDIYQDFFSRDADGAEYWSSLLSQAVFAEELIQRIIMFASATDQEALDATTSIARFYT